MSGVTFQAMIKTPVQANQQAERNVTEAVYRVERAQAMSDAPGLADEKKAAINEARLALRDACLDRDMALYISSRHTRKLFAEFEAMMRTVR